MDKNELKKKLLRKKVAKVGYVGKSSICIRIKPDALLDSGIELGDYIKMEGKAGKITISKLLPKEKKILGV